ncbi:CD48 antigen-like isoform X1 [Mastacembelus armatus]|uniref:CD48 antigen-like isoform X1 n=1 Tax=Mastacembelus armatus TaxID=205130 RepID=UPI000E464105|nr:CD48 antigen-like isoform X1 [Mastacembelus armatus]
MGPLFLPAVFLVICPVQGSSAVTPVFVQKGKDVTLDVMTDGFHELDVVFWRFNTSSVIVRFLPGKEPIVTEVYTGRVEFLQKKYSVTLKNLQESDSGVYTAQLIGTEEQTVAEHKVTVQAPVSPVKLTVDSVSNSSDSCNLTVTCSTQDSDITSRVTCDTTTCHQEGGESSKVTTSGASLRLYLVNSTINCNHSNQVSWTNDTKETGQACLLPPDKPRNHFIIVLVCVAVILVLVVSFLCYRRRRQCKYKPEVIENTVYAVPEAQPSPQTLDESSVNDASGPTTTYDLVGPHTGSTETRTKKLPESLYAQIEKPQRS